MLLSFYILGKASSRSSLTCSVSLSDDGLAAAATAVAIAAAATAMGGDKDFDDVTADDDVKADLHNVDSNDYNYEFHSSDTCMACMKICQFETSTDNMLKEIDSGEYHHTHTHTHKQCSQLAQRNLPLFKNEGIQKLQIHHEYFEMDLV